MRDFQNKVWVIRLWKWNKFQVELCIFRPNVEIALHNHRDCDVEVMHLFGSALYEIKYVGTPSGKFYAASWKDTFKRFTVKAGNPHGANIGKHGLITLSIQRWFNKPSLITTDYHE